MKVAEVISTEKLKSRFEKIPWGKIFFWLLVLVATVGLGLVVAYLIVSGDWLYAAVLLFAVPALVILHQNPFVGIIIWLLLMPFLLQTYTSASRQVYWLIHRILPLTSIAFLVLTSLFGKNPRRLPKLDIVEYSMGGYIFVSIVSILLLNETPDLTFFRFYDLFIIPMCLYLVIRLYVPNRKSLQLLVPVAVFITITQVVVGILSWVYPSVLPSAWLEYEGARTTGTVTSVSVYTTTIFFSGLIVLNAGILAKSKLQKYIFVLLFVLTIFATFISFSRASWLAGILIILSLVFIYPKFIGKFAVVMVVLSIVMGSIFLQSRFYQTATERLYSEEAENSALSRLPVYVAAYRMFTEKPIFGWGYDNFDRFDRRYQGRFGDLVNPDEKDHTSHNVYLTMLAEQGLLGVSFYLFPFIVLIWRSRKTIIQIPRLGVVNQTMFMSLWLVIMSFFIVQSFAPMVVVFGLGLNWITLGLIANYINLYSSN